MRAIQLVELDRPLRAVNLRDPEPGPGEILVRIRACGICHSDAHYRAGMGGVRLPRTPGHEVAGVVERCGTGVDLAEGASVALHYLISCGVCDRCRSAGEQFCRRGEMIGKDRDGGYAEAIVVPAQNAIAVPDAVPLEQAAIMMCSTATAFHALRLAALRPGESVALLGFGGLGASALELARALGAGSVAALDVVPEKLARAERLGAVAIDGAADVDRALADFGGSNGLDVALDFAGRPETSAAALRALAPGGRLVIVALTTESPRFDPYRHLVGREARILGCSDHLRSELVELMELARSGRIDLSGAVSATVPLDAGAIDGVLDDLARGTAGQRTVIVS